MNLVWVGSLGSARRRKPEVGVAVTSTSLATTLDGLGGNHGHQGFQARACGMDFWKGSNVTALGTLLEVFVHFLHVLTTKVEGKRGCNQREELVLLILVVQNLPAGKQDNEHSRTSPRKM